MAAILLSNRLGRPVGQEEATAIVAVILAGRTPDNPVAYVRHVITTDDDLSRYLPGQDAKSKKPRHLKHCGQCDPVTRLAVLADGRLGRCRNCHALRSAVLPQYWRCARCRAIILRTDRELPCDKHRTADDAHAAYDAMMAEAHERAERQRAEAQAQRAEAREMRAEAAAQRDWAGLHGEELARAQLEEARAAHLPDRVNAPAEPEPGPPGDNPDIDPATGEPWPF